MLYYGEKIVDGKFDEVLVDVIVVEVYLGKRCEV